MMSVRADIGGTVVDASLNVATLRRFHFHQRRPRAVVGSHALSVQKNAEWVSAKRIRHETEVVGRDEKVIHSREASEAKLDPIVKQLLLIRQIDQSDGLKPPDLLRAENIADVGLRKRATPTF